MAEIRARWHGSVNLLTSAVVLLLFVMPCGASASELEFRASEKAVFVVRDATFTATSRVLLFHATVDDRAGEDWDDVHVDMSVSLTCPDSTATKVNFTASLGNLMAGDNDVSDSWVSPKGILGCKAAEVAVRFKSGKPVSTEQSKERETGRKASEERLAKGAAETKADMEKEIQLIEECREIFRQTSNKKVSDLTVVESRAVKACEALGYYE